MEHIHTYIFKMAQAIPRATCNSDIQIFYPWFDFDEPPPIRDTPDIILFTFYT